MKFNLELENILYVKILYANSEGRPSTIKTAIKRIDKREIIACVKYEDMFRIDCPQQITLSIVCAEGLYRTKTLLKSYSAEAPYIFIYLETPNSLEYEQNREYFRVPVSYKCAYLVNNNGQLATFDTQIMDISASGVSIFLPVHVFSEDDAEISMMLEEKLVSAKVKYVRSERIDDGYKLSFMYTQISDKDRDYISQICIKKQLEAKRNKTM